MAEGSEKKTGTRPAQIIGRYAVYDEIAAGGMATVHLGRLLGPVGFSRTVAIKRLHPALSKDPEFTAMFLDEARLAARIRHPNVVQTLDVVARQGELFLVMDYVHGESLAMLSYLAAGRKETMPLGVVGTLISGMLQGLHAAHEACSERGERLEIVHRDVSPQNVLVGVDGIPRLLDFGIAKAMGRAANTRGAQLKGKIAYMSPEQITGSPVTRQTDIWGSAIVLWQSLTGCKLFQAQNDAETLYQILEGEIAPPSRHRKDVPPELDAVVLRGLERDPADRFATAQEMVVAFEKTVPMMSQHEVAEWVNRIAGPNLAKRSSRLAEIESLSADVRVPLTDPPPPPDPNRAVVVVAGDEDQAKPVLDSPYMTGMADTLPPPEETKPARKRAGLIAAIAAAVLALVAVISWQLVRPSAPAAAVPSAAEPSAEIAGPVSSASGALSAAAPEASSAALEPSASAPTAASASAAPPIGHVKVRPGTGTASKPGSNKPATGIYARE